MDKLSRMLVIIKPNDVLYSRDIHSIDLVNKIILSDEYDEDLKNKLFLEMTKFLKSNNINYENDFDTNVFLIKEESWDKIIINKKSNFETKAIYDILKENNLESIIYNTKLSYWNKAQIKELDLNENMMILNDDYIDDVLLLERSGIPFNKRLVIRKSEYIDTIISKTKYVDGTVDLYITLFTSLIDDIFEIYHLVKDDEYMKNIMKSVRMQMVLINENKYNIENVENVKKYNVPTFGILNLFDQELLSKINMNNVL